MTIPAYTAISDSLFGTGKAIPASMLLALRNNMWADNLRTEELTSKVLKPNGAGGVAWAPVPAGRSVYQVYDSGDISFWSGSPINLWLNTLTMESGGGVLHIEARLYSAGATLGYLPWTLAVTSGGIQSLNIPTAPTSGGAGNVKIVAQMSGQNVEFGMGRIFTTGTYTVKLQLTVYGMTAPL